jgi:multidrug efflux pump subunit AcrA (membrane-fusion protein)
MRKECLLQNRDSVANRIDEVLGEMQHGPARFDHACPQDPIASRSRSLSSLSADDSLFRSGSSLVQGARLDSVPPPTRHSLNPVLRTQRLLEVSRAHYPASRSIDTTLSRLHEYEIDSRRLGPRLQKVRALEEKLSDAREKYDRARQNAIAKRQQFEQLREAAAGELETQLKDDMLVFGSHAPTTVPIEFSKFSGRLLDTRHREVKSALFGMYDDAAALRAEAVQREREELRAMSEKFARSFNLQRQTMLTKQDGQRKCFEIFWARRKDQATLAIKTELEQLKKTVEHLEIALDDARRDANAEMERIRNNERIGPAPLAGRPGGISRAVSTFM